MHVGRITNLSLTSKTLRKHIYHGLFTPPTAQPTPWVMSEKGLENKHENNPRFVEG